MEASTGVPSPLAGRKVYRPKYKTLWQDECTQVDEFQTRLHETIASRNQAESAYKAREADYLAAIASRDLWRRVAVVEWVCVVVIALVLWLA